MNGVIVFTDGSSRGNPGPGGWAAIVVTDDEAIELGGGEPETTNNRMELRGAIEALSLLVSKKIPDATLYTDSSYLINGITKWVHGWKKKGWKTLQKEDVRSKDLWETLLALTENVKIDWKHIAGHAGAPGNERCDAIATGFADGLRLDLYHGDRASYPVEDIELVKTASLPTRKKSRSKEKAYSYISSLGGKVMTHKTWAECEARVKGQSGAKYKKVFSPEEERTLMSLWNE